MFFVRVRNFRRFSFWANSTPEKSHLVLNSGAFGFVDYITLVCIPVTGVQAQTQKVSIKMENVRMKQVMNEIERQTKFLFGINDDVDVNRLVTVNVTNQSLQAALDQMVKGTDITYQISSSNIILSKKQAKLPVDISGTIRDINGSPIVGATIVIRGTSIGISSGSDGSFSLQIPPPLPPGNWKSAIWAMRLWWSMWVTVLLSTLRFRSRPPRSNKSWSLLLVLSVRKRP